MTYEPTRDEQSFAGSQKFVHWLMAICIIAMLFLGVGMVSTVMPKYVPLVEIHKSLGIADPGAGGDPPGAAPHARAHRLCRSIFPRR